MKNILALVCLISLASSVVAHGLENIIVEKYYVTDANDAKAIGGRLPAGSVTYRIFIDMLPGYKFQAAFGIPGHELRISTTTTFFNNEDYGAVIPNVIPDRNLKENTVMLDSWLSVGGASENNLGILKADDNGVRTIANENGYLINADPEAGIPLTVQDGLISGEPPRVTQFGIDSIIKLFGNHNEKLAGNVFLTTNGSWASLNGSVGPTADNKVLIAQITTDGIFSFELNLQLGTPGGGVEQFVAKNAKGAEIEFKQLSFTSASPNYISKGNNKIKTKK